MCDITDSFPSKMPGRSQSSTCALQLTKTGKAGVLMSKAPPSERDSMTEWYAL